MRQVRYQEPEMQVIYLFEDGVYTDIVQGSNTPTIDETLGSDYKDFFG